LVPVDTSSLKDSGGVVPISSTKIHVGFGGPGVYHEKREPEKYALHVEYGTSESPAQPFLRPAFMQGTPTFKKRLKEEIEKLI
jgi:HK97 gp10 family phage protein